jgi:hypothetical protein
MKQPGLHDRHRDKNGEISRKHGSTLIRTLRRTYGVKLRCTLTAVELPMASKAEKTHPELCSLQLFREHGGARLLVFASASTPDANPRWGTGHGS